MDEELVRERAQRLSDALVAGDVGLATEDFSPELRQNLGEVIALLPLPASAATIESIDYGSNGFNVQIRLVGETEEVVIETRWKDRDDRPTVVEVSHQSRAEIAGPDEADDDEPASDAGQSRSEP
jgi:hypothetical protein